MHHTTWKFATQDMSRSYFIVDPACPQTRSVWEIIWSSFATIIACTWVSVHPNIPDRFDGGMKTFLGRLKIMIYAFLFPEFLIVWALRQKVGASMIAREYQAHAQQNSVEWTKSHGFFLQMGGFMLYRSSKPAYTILPPHFRELINANKIDFPRVRQDDIAHLSKGDFFSKGVVLLQTTWFVMQCGARWAKALGITELEVLTLGLAVLNGVTYALWWNKPLDVRWHMRVDLKPSEDVPEKDIFGSAVCIDMPGPDNGLLDVESNASPSHTNQVPHLNSATPIPHRRWECFTKSIVMVKSSLIQQLKERGLFRCIVLYFIHFPLWYLIVIPFSTVLTTMTDMILSRTFQTEPACAPTFYATNENINGKAFAGGIVIGSIFGAIHCIAWSFTFPSHAEEILWRTCALIVTVAPISLMLGALIKAKTDMVSNHQTAALRLFVMSLNVLAPTMVYISLWLYIIARMILLVLALVSLRTIPTNSLLQVDWVTFLPHV